MVNRAAASRAIAAQLCGILRIFIACLSRFSVTEGFSATDWQKDPPQHRQMNDYHRQVEGDQAAGITHPSWDSWHAPAAVLILCAAHGGQGGRGHSLTEVCAPPYGGEAPLRVAQQPAHCRCRGGGCN